MTINIPPPRIDRPVTLQFMGDWGRANLHRVMGWLGYELGRLTTPRMRFAIWNGTGGMDAVHAVGHGEIDVAIMTPFQTCARSASYRRTIASSWRSAANLTSAVSRNCAPKSRPCASPPRATTEPIPSA
jgi:hypothetical protein